MLWTWYLVALKSSTQAVFRLAGPVQHSYTGNQRMVRVHTMMRYQQKALLHPEKKLARPLPLLFRSFFLVPQYSFLSFFSLLVSCFVK